jgi:hypothetical protein
VIPILKGVYPPGGHWWAREGHWLGRCCTIAYVTEVQMGRLIERTARLLSLLVRKSYKAVPSQA